MVVVVKFGGSSMANAGQFEKVKKIVNANEDRKIVVVSAAGKRNSEDTKLTDLLFLLHAHLKYQVSYSNVMNMIENRFFDIKKELNLKFDLEGELNDLKSKLNKNTNQDFLVSRGEYITAKLMSEYLGYTFVDAKDLIFFNYDGSFNFAKIKEATKEAYQKYGKIIVPGFYGSLPDGNIKLLSRGGSDITGSLLAAAVDAAKYENWTDVSGVLMADPRIVKNPKGINQITYSELRELSYMGASVLHQETVFPVQQANIPINILNTNKADDPGTIIMENCTDKTQIITGIAGKKDFTSFTIHRDHISDQVGIVRDALDVFAKYNISIEHVPTGIDNFSVVVATADVEKCMYDLIHDLNERIKGSTVEIDDGIALIAVVGRNMASKPGISGQIFGVLGENGINIKMIAQGARELTIIVGVLNSDFEKTINTIYNHFVK
ncbi:MAG: aspartate kinase [Acholeplasmatales bacterium]|nr:aspartate kinase [Acholeplasmatales bacterium]